MTYFVYLLASRRHGTLYLGVTRDLLRRVWEHKNKVVPGFTTTYGVDRLVWYEAHGDITAAITREKQIKKWRRDWKIALVEADNPDWRPLRKHSAVVPAVIPAQAGTHELRPSPSRPRL